MRVAEINFDIEDAVYKNILEKGVTFADNSIIIPCQACEHGSSVVHLQLSNLLFIQEKSLSDGLCKSLASYGEVLDVGILMESTSKAFMCTGYAILDRPDRHRDLKDLTHVIPWLGSSMKNDFYVVWSDMGDYCQCCHSEHHTMDNCPKADDNTIVDSENSMNEYGFAEYVEFVRQKKREYINLKVISREGKFTTIKIKRVTSLYKLMHAYCKQYQKSLQNTCFLYYGQVLLHHQTPNDLGMQEGATINFVDNLIGGT